jgi:hypothetical protein
MSKLGTTANSIYGKYRDCVGGRTASGEVEVKDGHNYSYEYSTGEFVAELGNTSNRTRITIKTSEDAFMTYEDQKSAVWCGYHKRYNFNDTEIEVQDTLEELEAKIHENYNVAIIKPLYMFEHSGIAFSTTPFADKWDSGRLGFIFITKELAEGMGWETAEQLDKALEFEIEIKNKFESEEIYQVDKEQGEVCDCCGNVKQWEYIESAEGFDDDLTNFIENCLCGFDDE